MPMTEAEIVIAVKQALPDAAIMLKDTAGDNDHWVIHVTSAQFTGKSRVARHKMVLDAFGDRVVTGKLHSISIQTAAPGEASPMTNSVIDTIKKDIGENDIVLYMKGTKTMPQCGFSGTVVQVLERLGITEFKDVNVLADPAIREGIKQFANWPTIPQLYVKGEFIGGCDIVREMFQSGELAALLKEKGVATAA